MKWLVIKKSFLILVQDHHDIFKLIKDLKNKFKG